MAAYRFYCLDGSGRISEAEWIEAGDDQQAMSEAQDLKPDALVCEVWLRDRLVGKFGSQVA